MPKWLLDILLTVARYLVVAALGKLAGLGVPAEILEKVGPHANEIGTLIVGALISMAVYVQVQARRKMLTGLAMPEGSTEAEADAEVKAKKAPPISLPATASPRLRHRRR